MEQFKKKLPLALEVLQEVVGADTPLRYFCQDESRWGLLTLSGRVITLAGVKPEGIYQWGRSTFWLYGLVEPLTGEHFFEQYDHLNSENFEQFIHQFAGRAILTRSSSFRWTKRVLIALTRLTGLRISFRCFNRPTPLRSIPSSGSGSISRRPLQWETFKNLKSLRQRVNTVLSEMTTDVIRSVTGWEFITNAVLSASSN